MWGEGEGGRTSLGCLDGNVFGWETKNLIDFCWGEPNFWPKIIIFDTLHINLSLILWFLRRFLHSLVYKIKWYILVESHWVLYTKMRLIQILLGDRFHTPVGGDQFFVMLGGDIFGWELKFHEISVGGGGAHRPKDPRNRSVTMYIKVSPNTREAEQFT